MNEILMIHRIPSAVTQLGDWLADVADRVTLVTGEDGYQRYREAFPRVYAVPDYSANPVVERCSAKSAGSARSPP